MTDDVQAAKDAHPAFLPAPTQADLSRTLRRRVAWLRTTTERLPHYVRTSLADELEQLLNALDRDEAEREAAVSRAEPLLVEMEDWGRALVAEPGACEHQANTVQSSYVGKSLLSYGERIRLALFPPEEFRPDWETERDAIAHDDGTGLYRLDASTTGVG